ncbi:GNAT family N-acetyltransferase [Bradyrhizobium liaoningense]|uniref:GNAT family N-acetyltransferase n=1 Tax=Bradyrhizobium liaoningense TaxID=43992 RepID=UPI001BAC8287|nr:GNAT family N-acetyltransferase [Bradyrhizobium liaoningense]MBR0712692.1 GNAT family N-acetyltransferase [Bradyrhizobium liaoningense]
MASLFDLRTERLFIRRLMPSDAPQLFASYAGDPYITRYLSFKRHETQEQTAAYIDEMSALSAGNNHVFAVCPVGEPWRPVGVLGIGVHGGDTHNSVSVGFGM